MRRGVAPSAFCCAGVLVLALGFSAQAQEEGEGTPAPAAGALAQEIARMGDIQFKAREEAFHVLSGWARRFPEAREVLAQAVAVHADLEVRERARMVLEETELDYAQTRLGIEGLAQKLRSGDVRVQFEAIASLPRVDEAFGVLKAFAADRQADPQLRAAALEILARIPLVETAAFLSAVARDPQDPLRERAVFWLGRLRVASVLPYLSSIARDARDPVRLRACYALTILGDPAAAPVFRDVLQDIDAPEDLKSMAAIGCGALADGQAVPILMPIAQGEGLPPSSALRIFALRSLGRIRDPRAVACLGEIVGRADEDATVQREACLALGQSRAWEAVGILRACLETETKPLRVRKAAVAALRRITGWSLPGPVPDQVVFYQEVLGR